MSADLTPDRKQLLYRAMHRGFKEADIVIGRFAEANLAGMSQGEVDEFRALLEVPDQDLYGWIIGRAEAPANFQGPVLQALQAFDVAATMDR